MCCLKVLAFAGRRWRCFIRCSWAAPAASDAALLLEGVTLRRCQVGPTDTSLVRHLPRDHGMNVTPLGRLRSDLREPSGLFGCLKLSSSERSNTISFNRCWCCRRLALLYGKISRALLWRQLQLHANIRVVNIDWCPDACKLHLLWPHLIDEDLRLLSAEHGVSSMMGGLRSQKSGEWHRISQLCHKCDVSAAVLIPQFQIRCFVASCPVGAEVADDPACPLQRVPEMMDPVKPLIPIEVLCSGDPRYLQPKQTSMMVPTG